MVKAVHGRWRIRAEDRWVVAVLLHQLDLQFATVGQRQTKLQRTRNSIDLMLWVFDMLQDEKGADAEFGCPLPNGVVEIVHDISQLHDRAQPCHAHWTRSDSSVSDRRLAIARISAVFTSKCRGDEPVQRRNAALKLALSLYPNFCAISSVVRRRSSRYRTA